LSIADEFSEELKRSFRDYQYQWSKGKEVSCSWIIERIEQGIVADIGGTQWLLEQLHSKGLECTYFDAFPPKGQLSEGIAVKTGDLHQVADLMPRASYDYVVLRHTLEHALNPLLVLWQVNLLLKTNGKAFVIVPCHIKYWVWFYTHFSCLPMENWRMIFFRAGFEIIEESIGNWHDDQKNSSFTEHRFMLRVSTRNLRLSNPID
jgi:SAM-dependent methyltransferase